MFLKHVSGFSFCFVVFLYNIFRHVGAKTWISAHHFHFPTVLSGNTDFSVHMARHLHPVLLWTAELKVQQICEPTPGLFGDAHMRRGIWSAMCNLLVPLGDEVKHATCTFLGGDRSCFLRQGNRENMTDVEAC